MDSRKFFIENRNIQSVSTSFLTEKIPKFGLLITEILNQSCPKLLNNTYDGLPSKDRSTKASFCKEFDIKIENLMALFNYEFCYLVISKINVKTICLNLLRDGKFDECMNTYETSEMKFMNSKKFQSEFQKTKFYQFHFEDSRIDIDSNVLRQSILSKIKDDLKMAKIDIENSDDIYQNAQTILNLLIEDSSVNLKINISIKDLLTTKFFSIAGNLRNNYEKIIEQYGLKKTIDENIISNLATVNFPFLITKINQIYPKFSIKYDERMLTMIVNYFIELGLQFQREIFILVNYGKSSRVRFESIFRAVTSIPYSRLNSEHYTFIHYILFTNSDISKGLELTKEFL